MTKRILWIYIPALSGGGTEKFFVQLANFLSPSYAITYFYSITSNSPYLDPRCNFVQLNTKSALLSAFKLTLLSHKYKPDIILTAQNHCNLFFSLFKPYFYSHTKLVISERALASLALTDQPSFARQLIKFLIPFFYNNANLIVTQTKSVRLDLIHNFNIHCHKIIIIPNFVDKNMIEYELSKALPLAGIIDQDNPYIIAVGRLVIQKGHKNLIIAFHKITHLIPHLLYICGEGPELDNLVKLCSYLNISHRVKFLGYISTPYKLIMSSSLFVLPSLYEGMPNVLLEAICIGVPLISADCPSGPYEILGSRYGNLLYKPTDIQRLSEIIYKQLFSPQIVDKKVLNPYTVQSVTNQFHISFSALIK